ncbi:putative conjugative transfer protein TraH [Orientia tsutsugamushi str. Ikeda]|uniref:Putative conjugative transfer protein TraH n=2 Tax=Orientia tsutsugamushi (strain Ikeda) TaxID=334380 RepID=B3CTY5_ORITI|nr:putative conjugative transfer protein TraH [Orientia tsutsugamushi str. Ikeda]BAG40947.1 putative conjugative transfer protein TraH [Orientia tsutsugamushi str. Ikeda]
MIMSVACIQRLRRNITISPEQSYAGKAKQQLTNLKNKFDYNTEFSNHEIAFLSSIGDIFPIYDYIILEYISGVTILDSSSELIASYTLVQHLKEVITEIRRAVTSLGAKQVSNEHLERYLKELNRVQLFANEKWTSLQTDANRIDKRARLIEQHLIAKEKS